MKAIKLFIRRLRWLLSPPPTIILCEAERLSKEDAQAVIMTAGDSSIIRAYNQLIRHEIAEWLQAASTQAAAGTGSQAHSCGAIDGLTRVLGDIKFLTDNPPDEE